MSIYTQKAYYTDELQNSTQGIYCNELGKEKVLMVLH
jgi:hypothetical protein